MKKTDLLESVKSEFEKVQKSNLDQHAKNLKYGSLMTVLENHYSIPMLDNAEFQNMDNDVKSLYLSLSNARNFEIYEN